MIKDYSRFKKDGEIAIGKTPKAETISFLLSYSKALNVIKLEDDQSDDVEFILN